MLVAKRGMNAESMVYKVRPWGQRGMNIDPWCDQRGQDACMKGLGAPAKEERGIVQAGNDESHFPWQQRGNNKSMQAMMSHCFGNREGKNACRQ